VKTVCDTDVAQLQLQSISPVVSVSSTIQIMWLMQSSLQHGTVVAVFLDVLLLLYLSLSLSLSVILIPLKSAHYLTFPLDT